MDIANVLTYLRPGEVWSLNGDSYEGLVWLDTTKQPTLQELEIAWLSYKKKIEAEKHNGLVLAKIEECEKKIIRPMVAMAQNTSTPADVEKFLGLKAEIENLRNQLIKEENHV